MSRQRELICIYGVGRLFHIFLDGSGRHHGASRIEHLGRHGAYRLVKNRWCQRRWDRADDIKKYSLIIQGRMDQNPHT
jgi:hypothetical protein